MASQESIKRAKTYAREQLAKAFDTMARITHVISYEGFLEEIDETIGSQLWKLADALGVVTDSTEWSQRVHKATQGEIYRHAAAWIRAGN